MSNQKVNDMIKRNCVTDCKAQSISYARGTYLIKLNMYPEVSVKDFLSKLFGKNIIIMW
jgi:hypothetical protein